MASDFLAVKHAAAFVLFAEVVLNGFVVTVGDADELRGEAETKGFEFVQLGCEGLSLARSVPFANDGLKGDIGAERDFVCAGADLDVGPEGFVEFLPAFVSRPVLGDFALSEMDEVKGPPFFDFKEPGKGEGVEKCELPIVVLREFVEHGAHRGFSVGLSGKAGCGATGAALEPEKFRDEKLGAAAINFGGLGVLRTGRKERVGRPAQIVEGEHGMGAQKFAGGLERISHWAVGAGEHDHDAVVIFARGRQDDFHFAGGHQLFGETFDEPGWEIRRAGDGVAIGEFKQKGLRDGADVFAAIHQVRELEEIFPAIAKAFAVDGDWRIGSLRAVQGEMDSAAPGCGVGEVTIDELFDAFGGDGEESGIENDESRVGAEMGCGFRRAGTAGVLDEELAGDAANEGGVLG